MDTQVGEIFAVSIKVKQENNYYESGYSLIIFTPFVPRVVGIAALGILRKNIESVAVPVAF